MEREEVRSQKAGVRRQKPEERRAEAGANIPVNSKSAPQSQNDKILAAVLGGLMVLTTSLAQGYAATLTGTVFDPNGRVVAGARVSLMESMTVLEERQSDQRGAYQFENLKAGTYRLVANAAGFSASSTEVPLGADESRSTDLHLELSAVREQVVVSASLGGALAPQIGSSVNVVTQQDIEDRGAQSVLEVLRGIPGVEVNQTGRRGGATGVFIRGGYSDYNLVMLDGIQVNQFGGDFDFAPLASDGVDRVEVIRGPESALYGSNAVTGVINIVSRRGEGPPHFTVRAEAGNFTTRRFGTGGSGLTHDLSWAYDLSRLDSGGTVTNDNFRNQTAYLSLGYSRRPSRQLTFHFFGDANDAGAPGPYGSNPLGLYNMPEYPGGPTPYQVGLTSRDKQNMFAYSGTYAQQFGSRFRQVVSGALATSDYYFSSPLGDSYSNNLRGVGNTRSEVNLSNQDFLVFGVEYNREQVKNTYIANSGNTPFLLPRTSTAFFAENRWSPSNRLFIIAGVRLDDLHTGALAPDAYGTRPAIAASTVTKVNPRLSVAYLAHDSGAGGGLGLTRLHASFGTGIRAPNGFELAFTDNPHLKPEKSVSLDGGVEQRLGSNRAVLDATYFYNRFNDQIVVLGGSLTSLSSFTSDNLANSKAQGMEFSFRTRPTRSLDLGGEYTLLDTSILALTGATQAQFPFQAGQQLIRRPRNSGGLNLTWRHKRLTLNTNAYFRGKVLDLEPNDGAFACTLGFQCLFTNPSYTRADGGFAYRMVWGVEIYGRLNNFLNKRYEESFGYPALPLNFLAGVRFSFPAE